MKTDTKQKVPAEVFPPGEFLAEELEARGWSQTDFAEILGRPPRLVNEIIQGKRAISTETARGIADALGTSAEYWLNLEAIYQLRRLRSDEWTPPLPPVDSHEPQAPTLR